MITLDKVTYWYREGSNPVLRNVSLEINRGESVCVMGRNGSGKSTLAKLIAGLVNPGRGHISINGQAPTVDSGSSGVGILFQNPDNQMVATLVEKEIAFALENRAMPQPKMEREVSRIAERFEIGHLRRRLTSTLSGGEKQRVALASVMVQNPHVLVLDEPDSFLDEAGRRLLEAELARLHREYPGLIEIRITQDPSVAHSYKRLVVLDGGMVVADDKPAATFADSDFTHRAGLTYSLARKSELTVSAPLRAGTSAAELRVDRIVIDRVGFVYPMSTEILEDISLSLRRGELVGLVGPTGVGKTSLGLLACGILQPAAGTISYLDGSGRSISRSNLRGQVVALLQQPERQFFLDTCAREIAFGPSNLGYELSEMDIDGFFEMVGLNPMQFRNRDPFTLSAGEKRRLAFAAVLSMAPSFVVFDEPAAGLDQEGVGRFVNMALLLKDQGIGQMIISHNGDLIRKLADRVLYLKSKDRLIELTSDEFFDSQEYAGVVSRPTSISED